MNALVVQNRESSPVMQLDTCPKPAPGRKELLVNVKATALNRADLLQKAGKYPPPAGASRLLGLEMAGVVEEAGPETSRFKKGDRIFGLLPGGGYAGFCTILESHAMEIPKQFSFEEAAAIPEVFLTAYQALIWLGKLSVRETVLIHAGASGVGTAAIQIAKQLKQARVAATSGTSQKCTTCNDLGAELTINYKEQNFEEAIAGAFGTESVNLIVDVVGAPYWHQNINVLALAGRLVYLAMLGGANIENMNLAPLLKKRITVQGSTLRNRTDSYKARLVNAFVSDCMPLFSEGKMNPVIDSVFNWKQVEKAHEKMKQNLNTGKIILNGM